MFQTKKYAVHYNGCSKDSFLNAKDSYREGEQVTLYYHMFATDTDYSFSVSGAEYTTGYGDNGYEIRFTMPAGEVTVNVRSRNSMLCMPPEETEEN